MALNNPWTYLKDVEMKDVLGTVNGEILTYKQTAYCFNE